MRKKEYYPKEPPSILYSQNFIRRPELVETLIETSSIGKNDVVYEIGPGTGVITAVLARFCKKVIAIEIDRRLCAFLNEKFSQTPNIEIHQGDFLTYPLPKKGEYKVFSNPPFRFTADIIRKLTRAENPPIDSYLIIQKEAAQRFMGKPKETLPALLITPWFNLSIVHCFNRKDFKPFPKVDIVLLRLVRRKNPYVARKNAEFYRDFVTYAFTQRQPNIKVALRKIFTNTQIKRLSRDLGFSLLATPSELNFNQWLGLFQYFLIGVTREKKALVRGAEKRLFLQQKRLKKIRRTRNDPHWRQKR
ncbi:23S ribosomal RNA methyltransferase Erm [bacterium]|nr:23S ribosomal RNA methyltransferase Erm [bacterium]